MASCEEQVCCFRDETEWRPQLQNAAGTMMHKNDVHQLVGHREELAPQPQEGSTHLEGPHQEHKKGPANTLMKYKEEDPELFHMKEEEEETDVSKMRLTVVPVTSDDSAPESPQLSCRLVRPPPEKFSAPLSDSDHVEDGNDADRGGDDKAFDEKIAGSCSYCDKTFAQNGPLIRHMRTHTGEKPHTCSVCGKGFTNKSDMVRHMRTHTGEKPFNCSLCEKKFSHKESLVAHVRTHTGEKPFICSVCGKTFTQNSSMVAHMRIHTGEKPYSCSVCGKRFILKPNMVSHMRTHSGEKPYGCSLCDKTFSFKSCVVTHMRTHTGEKPFRCSLCGERYAQRANLTAHKRIHHTE
ncbi:zinc finger protein OZF [Syngnathus scovelli]|uniref:zinc finger protein OZF n=1 Tax=Syngnathus scovelli TaxID=161590 RepID=UPI00210FC360|nr:zinc finger protein OZF [Syngnathus scovelli]